MESISFKEKQVLAAKLNGAISTGLTHHQAKYNFNNKAISTKSYLPKEFKELRALLCIDDEHFFNAFSKIFTIKNNTLHHRSFLYYSGSFAFAVKTIKKSEKQALLNIFYNYKKYLLNNPNTLLSKIFGCMKIKEQSRKKLYFIITNNIFQDNKEITQIFNLKGAIVNRYAQNNSITTLKYTTFEQSSLKLCLMGKKILLEQQIKADALFLEQMMILDYSMIIGIKNGLTKKSKQLFETYEIIGDNNFVKYEFKENTIKYNISNFTRDNGGYKSENEKIDRIYYVGITDFLTTWTIRKKIVCWIGILCCKKNVSCFHPKDYKKNFIKMLEHDIL